MKVPTFLRRIISTEIVRTNYLGAQGMFRPGNIVLIHGTWWRVTRLKSVPGGNTIYVYGVQLKPPTTSCPR